MGNFPKIPKIAFIKACDSSKCVKNAKSKFLNEFSMIFDDFRNVLCITALKCLSQTLPLLFKKKQLDYGCWVPRYLYTSIKIGSG